MNEIVTADNSAFEIARRKSRYGHSSWLVFRRKDGSYVAASYSAQAIKAALLAGGTQGRFSWYDSTGVAHICRSWSFGIYLYRCARSIRNLAL